MGAKDMNHRSSSSSSSVTSSSSTTSSSSSPQSSLTIISRNPAGTMDAYYLECRKDAQCVCTMCKESLTATRDLIPATARKPSNSPLHRSSPNSPSSNHNNKRKKMENEPWPPPFVVCTPPRKQRNGRLAARFPELDPAPCRFRNVRRFLGPVALTILICAFVFDLGSALPFLFGASAPRFGYGGFAQIAEGSLARRRLADRLDYVHRQVNRAVRGATSSSAAAVSNCTGTESVWRLEEEGYFIHSWCDIYSSQLERVSVWGYGSKTSGVLGRSLVDRSFTVLSGKVFEWREGGIEHTIHPDGSSWTMPKWAASTILLDGDTWVLEYKRTTLSQGLGGLRGLLYLTTKRISSIWRTVKHVQDKALFVRKHVLDTYGSSSTSIPRPT